MGKRNRRRLSAKAAAAMGRLGGPARARSLTRARRRAIARKAGRKAQAMLSPEERSAAGRRAVLARWAKRRRRAS